MQRPSPYFADGERLTDSSEIREATLRGAGVTFASYRRDQPGLGLTKPNPNAEMFMAVVMMRNLPSHGGWRDGRYDIVPDMIRGSLACLDFRETWISELPHAFHTVHAFIPRSCFDDLTHELRSPRIDALDCSTTLARVDRTMYGMAVALEAMMAASRPPSLLVTDHIVIAMVGHLASTYGGLSLPTSPVRGSIESSAVQRAAEMLLDDIRADIGLTTLASACGLTVRQLQRAFFGRFGTTPHRWRADRRMELAKERLEFSDASLSDIADLCGFADQSHFTRVFSQLVGVSPGVFRRRVNL